MINSRCRHFRGSRPCVFNKTDGSECPNCGHVSAYKERILFIKLDAVGDVLRSASLLPAVKARHETRFIAWLNSISSGTSCLGGWAGSSSSMRPDSRARLFLIRPLP